MEKEFIGKKVSLDFQNKTITGIIINETKFTFTIRTTKGDKKILKKGKDFKINNKKIDGNKILKRPEERIKCKK
jgi:RNase P/RNase MRP subunit p29